MNDLTLSMQLSGVMIFVIALVMPILSRAIPIREIRIPVRALDLHLRDMER